MQTNNESTTAATFRMIPITLITPSPTNPRKHLDQEGIAQLAESVKIHGVLQPILVRPTNEPGATGAAYQIIAGERRYRAAVRASLSEIPSRIVMMNDMEVLEAQIVENIQRQDVHPLDEADGFMHLKEVTKLDLAQIAQRVAKDERYVTRRLALTNLIEEAKADLRTELITLAHALEICRLSPDIQKQALAACYERKPVWSQKDQTHRYVADKEKPVRHVKYLQAWLVQNVHLNLHKAPFKMDDPRLRADSLTCIECPQRTGYNKGLFEDVKNGETCLNPGCFQAKLQRFVQIKKAALDAKGIGHPTAYISSFYEVPREQKDALTRYEYQLLEKKADRCRYAEQAIYSDGSEIGQVRWICRRKDCKDHLGRVRQSSSSLTTGGGVREVSPEDRSKRKQEIFDIKVDEIVRKRVMAEALNTYRWPLERKYLNEAVKEFFRRIPADDQKTIIEVFGWSEKDTASLRYDDSKVLGEIASLDDSRLAQFLMLCSFAHYGANQYKQHHIDQKAMVQLSRERGVNHTLIDAQVRAELSPKKYQAAHQTYLSAVRKGETAQKPVVYEQPQATTKQASKEEATEVPATKPSVQQVNRPVSPHSATKPAVSKQRKVAAKAAPTKASAKKSRRQQKVAV